MDEIFESSEICGKFWKKFWIELSRKTHFEFSAGFMNQRGSYMKTWLQIQKNSIGEQKSERNSWSNSGDNYGRHSYRKIRRNISGRILIGIPRGVSGKFQKYFRILPEIHHKVPSGKTLLLKHGEILWKKSIKNFGRNWRMNWKAEWSAKSSITHVNTEAPSWQEIKTAIRSMELPRGTNAHPHSRDTQSW